MEAPILNGTTYYTQQEVIADLGNDIDQYSDKEKEIFNAAGYYELYYDELEDLYDDSCEYAENAHTAYEQELYRKGIEF